MAQLWSNRWPSGDWLASHRLWPRSVDGPTLIASLMGPTWGPPGADTTQVGPMLAPWTLLSGYCSFSSLGNSNSVLTKYYRSKVFITFRVRNLQTICELMVLYKFPVKWCQHKMLLALKWAGWSGSRRGWGKTLTEPLLQWFDFYPNTDMWSHPMMKFDMKYYIHSQIWRAAPFECWWCISNFILHFTENVIIYLCCVISETMWVSWEYLMLSTLSFLVTVSSVTGHNATAYFTDNRKPLQCHEIESREVRSAVDCCLHCIRNLYSCAGYTLDRNGNSDLRCSVCYIYDVTTPLVTIPPPNNGVSGMPDINKTIGKDKLWRKTGARVTNTWNTQQVNGLAQDCSNSIAYALELPSNNYTLYSP